MHGLFIFPEIPYISPLVSQRIEEWTVMEVHRVSLNPHSHVVLIVIQLACQLSEWIVTQVRLQNNCELKPGDTWYLHLRMMRTGESQMTTRARVIHVPVDSK
jgi:hypothetical protein